MNTRSLYRAGSDSGSKLQKSTSRGGKVVAVSVMLELPQLEELHRLSLHRGVPAEVLVEEAIREYLQGRLRGPGVGLSAPLMD